MGYRVGYFEQSDGTAGLRIWRRGELVASFGNRNHMPVCHEIEIEGTDFLGDTATVTEIVEQLSRNLSTTGETTPDPDCGCATVTIGDRSFDLNWQCLNRQELGPFLGRLSSGYTRLKQLLAIAVDGHERVCSDMTESQIDAVIRGETPAGVG